MSCGSPFRAGCCCCCCSGCCLPPPLLRRTKRTYLTPGTTAAIHQAGCFGVRVGLGEDDDAVGGAAKQGVWSNGESAAAAAPRPRGTFKVVAARQIASGEGVQLPSVCAAGRPTTPLSWVGRGGRAPGRRQKKIVPRGDGPRVVCVLRRRGGAEQQQEDDGRAVALLGLGLPTGLAPRGPVKCRAERVVGAVGMFDQVKSRPGQAKEIDAFNRN